MRKIKIIIMLSVIATALNSCFLFNSSEIDNSLLPVKSGEKWGYINHKGKFVINPQFDEAGFFRDGLARVENSNKIGYINKKGKIVIPVHYDEGTNYYEGKAFVVQPDGYPLCIDKEGNILFSLKDAKYAFGFSNGMAKIAVMDKNGVLKYGFVNENGVMVIASQYDNARSFSNGFAAVEIKKKWGFINKKGEIIITPQFDHVHDFHNGLARFTNGEKWGYVDKNGNIAINSHFEWCEDFNNEYALVKEDGMYGYIDKNGKYTMIPQFEWAKDFHNGLAQFKLNDKYGYINKSGQMVIMAQFDEATDFFLKDLAFVKLGGKYGLIDHKGKFCTTPQVDYVHRFPDNRFDEVMDPYEPFLSDGFWVSSQYHDASSEDNSKHSTEHRVREVIESYCSAIVNNDFDELSSLYAPVVEKYQSAENKDREYIIGCHRRYDDKFKVYGKRSSIRWETFHIEDKGERVYASVVEDYSIDREDHNKYSYFVLEKHFVLNRQYQIVSIYDVQLEKKKTESQTTSNMSLASDSYKFLKGEFEKVHKGGLDDGTVYGSVDFRKNDSFVQLVKQIVNNGCDYNTMLNSGVLSTEFGYSGNGRAECFEIEGSKYTISFHIGNRSEYSIVITVNGEKYEWTSSGFYALF